MLRLNAQWLRILTYDIRLRLSGRAPLGDPLMLVLGDQEYTLSVRASEAATILLKEKD